MLYPIQDLIKGRDKPLCVKKDMKVGDALALMMEHDYSQLPIVNDAGELTGIITEQSILNTYFNVGDKCGLLDLTVDHCRSKQTQISPQNDIFDALDLLKNVSAIIVVVENKPVGIVTDYDTTVFFHNYSDGMILVQDVETTLKQYILEVLDTNELFVEALKSAHLDYDDPSRPPKNIDDLTFAELEMLIETTVTWGKFEPYFKNKPLFHGHMEKVRIVRNQLAHFRGELTNLQRKQLKQAIDWLEARPKATLAGNVIDIIKTEAKASLHAFIDGKKGKYTPFEEWLTEQAKFQKNIRIKFENIEEILGESLPDSANKHRAWWANDYSHPEAVAWIRAGWLVDNVDFNTKDVTFRQSDLARYLVFFTDVLENLKKIRPGFTTAQKASLHNWFSFSAGTSGFLFGWVLPKEHILRVEVYIDKGDYASTKEAFEKLKELRAEIEAEIGVELQWDKIEKARACRIYASTPFHISESPEAHEKTKLWGVAMMLKFIDTFQPRIRGL